jgi:hypothetical protein
LERDGRKGSERLFARFGEMLEAQGLIGHEGSIVDASFVDAPRTKAEWKTRNSAGKPSPRCRSQANPMSLRRWKLSTIASVSEKPRHRRRAAPTFGRYQNSCDRSERRRRNQG